MVHPLADCMKKNVPENTRIWQFCVIFPNCEIGENCNICANVLIENEVNGYGPITELLKDKTITEIMVNGKEVLNNKFDMPRIGNVTLTAEFEESSFDITRSNLAISSPESLLKLSAMNYPPHFSVYSALLRI